MNGTQKPAEQDSEARQDDHGAVKHLSTRWSTRSVIGNRTTASSRYLLDEWNEVRDQLRDAEACALLLDFDGTLVRIQRRPWEVRVPKRTKQLLARLAKNPKLFVAIVSGRRCADLQTRIGVDALHYIGLHGAEEDGKSIRIGKHAAKILAAARRAAQARTSSMRGIRIENKRLSFAVHYREATQPVADSARACLLEIVAPLRDSLKVFDGAMVWEVLPHAIQGKGMAAQNFMSTLPKGTRAIYMGDDGTDESAFRSLSDQITIRVGNPLGSRARYYLKSPREVIDFLLRLEFELSQRRAATERSRMKIAATSRV